MCSRSQRRWMDSGASHGGEDLVVLGIPDAAPDAARQTLGVGHSLRVGRQQHVGRTRNRADRTGPVHTRPTQHQQVADGRVRTRLVRAYSVLVGLHPTRKSSAVHLLGSDPRRSARRWVEGYACVLRRRRRSSSLRFQATVAEMGASPKVSCGARKRSCLPRRTMNVRLTGMERNRILPFHSRTRRCAY